MVSKKKELTKVALKGVVKLLVPLPVVGDIAAHGVGMMIDSLKTQTDRFTEAEADDAARSVEEWQGRIEERLDALAATRDVAPSDVAAVFRAWWEAYRTAQESKKRELIMVALCNSFDQELYEQGITRRLFTLLADLDYGELWLLRSQLPPSGVALYYDPNRSPHWLGDNGLPSCLCEERDAAGMQSFHLAQLIDAQLVRIQPARPLSDSERRRPPSFDPRDLRLCEKLEVTALGERLRKLLASAEEDDQASG